MQHITILLLQLAFQFSLNPISDAFARTMSPFLMTSTAEHFLDLLKDGSTLLQDAPQRSLVSYSSIQPESLSRIHKRIAKG